MKRHRDSLWRGWRTERHPRRVVSLDSLLTTNQVNSTESEQSLGIEMHENVMNTHPHSAQDSVESHGTVQPPEQVHEQLGELGSESGPSTSEPLLGTKKTRFGTVMEWTSEIAAIFSAFGCLTAIYIILGAFDTQQQPDWPYARTLNLSTLIALIATILRSMLEVVLSSSLGQLKWHWFQSAARPLSHIQSFEDASRGAWGSILFICSNARLNLATLGAVMTIMSVVIGTLTQQAIQTVPCQKSSSDGTASVPIAQTVLNGVEATAARSHALTKDLKASLIAGLAGLQQPNSFSPTCSSGQCVFQPPGGFPYSTVGLASECIDITALVTQGGFGIDAWASNQNPANLDPESLTNYTLPNGLTLSYMLGPGTPFGLTGGRWPTVLAQAQLEDPAEIGLSPQNITMTDRQKYIVSESNWVDAILLLMPTINPCEKPSDYYSYFDTYELVTMPATKANSCPELNLPGVDTLPGYFSVTAAACFFYTSLQQYESAVVANGALKEDPLPDSGPMKSLSNAGDSSKQAQSCWLCTFLDPCIVDHVEYTNTSANLSSVPGGTTVLRNVTGPLRCLYGFGYPWYRALLAESHLWNTIGRLDTHNDCLQAGNYTSMVCTDTWWLNDLFNGGNASIGSISMFMQRGFDSISRQIRMIGTDWDGNPTNISGTTSDTVVCVLFRWEWLFYPLALVLGALVLLLLLLASSSTRVRSRREVVWKSSVLPFLFYGLEDQLRDQGPHLEPQKELNRLAKGLNTRFHPRDDGWRLYYET